MVALNQGALTFDDMMAVWRSVTDRAYNRPLLEEDDSLIEVIELAGFSVPVPPQ